MFSQNRLWSVMISKERRCPVCKRGIVRVEELRHGAECNHCRSVIEVDAFYSMGVGLVLALCWLTLFRLDLGDFAMPFVVTSVIYGIWIYQIPARWLPLKCYEK